MWQKSWTPISPERDPDGGLRAIRELFGPRVQATPIPLSDEALAAGRVKMSMSYTRMSQAVAASLSVGKYVDTNVNFHKEIHVFDFAVGCFESFDEATLPVGQIITATFWGMSLRVLFRARSLDAKAKIDFNAGPVGVAAAVELGHASVEFQVDAICSDPLVFASVLEGVPLTGKFDIQAYARFSQKLADAQLAMLRSARSNPGKLLPIGVLLSDNADERNFLDEAKSIRWALGQIAAGRALDSALAKLASGVDKAVVEETYRHCLGKDGTAKIKAADAKWAQSELR
jgi:hypothetical protein